MIEIPEANSLAGQVRGHLVGRTIRTVISGASPHRFAWYFGEPEEYQSIAEGHTVSDAHAVGGMLEVQAGPVRLLFAEGVNPRLHIAREPRPEKHQFLVEFDDGSYLVCRVQMYGGMGVFREGECENDYYLIARKKPDILCEQFSRAHFESILNAPGVEKLSAKALLATEQRIPGLGNGVLQDILFNAGVNPRTKTSELGTERRSALYESIKSTVLEMSKRGGRDTETDLFGNPGGYRTRMSRNTVGTPCTECGQYIQKASYLGGTIYYCPQCQPL